MKKRWFLFLSLLFFSCNRLESEATLAPADVAVIRAAALLDPGETIRCFHTRDKELSRGSFVTDQRIGSYYLAPAPGAGKYVRQSALFADIVKLEVVHESELLDCPYIGVHEKGKQWGFMVSIHGRQEEVQGFYDEAYRRWLQHRHKTRGIHQRHLGSAGLTEEGTGQ